MDREMRSVGWREVASLLLAANSVVFGFLFANAGNLCWAIAIGFAPGVLLFVGLGLRKDHGTLATALMTVSSAAAVAFWMIYPVILALVVIGGGFSTAKVGFDQRRTLTAWRHAEVTCD